MLKCAPNFRETIETCPTLHHSGVTSDVVTTTSNLQTYETSANTSGDSTIYKTYQNRRNQLSFYIPFNTTTTEIATNPANMDTEQPKSDNPECIDASHNVLNTVGKKDGIVSEKNDELPVKAGQASDGQEPCQETASATEEDRSKQDDEVKTELVTAFTISFGEDDTSRAKGFGLRDSIRKFAPPKPHTIEKPRPPKASDQSQEQSFNSIESAPANMTRNRQYSKPGCPNSNKGSNFTRTSSQRSTSSQHSNLSESAVFLIDRMLQARGSKQQQGDEDIVTNSNSTTIDQAKSPHTVRQSLSVSSRQAAKAIASLGEVIADFDDDNASDNGTYIVGADPESDAARQKIDELFGVVKAAQSSVIADRSAKQQQQAEQLQQAAFDQARSARRSRRAEAHERKRSSTRGSSSRGSSSSSSHQQQHNDSRQSDRQARRNYSCERNSNLHHERHQTQAPRQRRSASQSSRQSSHKELSDGDCNQGSLSPINHNPELDLSGQNHENALSSLPSMKYNRAFALRRARLGLGEPVASSRQPLAQTNTNNVDYNEAISMLNNNNNNSLNHLQRGQQAVSGGAKPASATHFSRQECGRFSLRTKSNPMGNRVNSALGSSPSSRSPQHAPSLIDGYVNRLGGTKTFTLNQQQQHQQQQHKLQLQQQYQQHMMQSRPNNPKQHGQQSSTNSMPYQTNSLVDELDTLDNVAVNCSRHVAMVKPGRSQTIKLAEQTGHCSQEQLEQLSCESQGLAMSSTVGRNYSLGSDLADLQHHSAYADMSARASSQLGQRSSANSQLGALDSLVISAISSLSLKIRQSVCGLLVDNAKKLPEANETRLIVEEILPQLTDNGASLKSPPSIEELDQSLYFDLAKTLKNLKKVEQMVEVISLISSQLPGLAGDDSSSGSPTSPPVTMLQQQQHYQHHHQQQHQLQQRGRSDSPAASKSSQGNATHNESTPA